MGLLSASNAPPPAWLPPLSRQILSPNPSQFKPPTYFCRMSEKRAVLSEKAPAPIGPYSQAIVAGGLVFCSGQVALGPTGTEQLPFTVEDQCRKVMDNLREVLTAAGSGFDRVVKTTIYLNDMDDFASVNQVYASYFTAPFPARETVAVVGLPKNALVEISVIATLA
jgi:2-iminobutanoate/2-iminopropanoate deaminase